MNYRKGHRATGVRGITRSPDPDAGTSACVARLNNVPLLHCRKCATIAHWRVCGIVRSVGRKTMRIQAASQGYRKRGSVRTVCANTSQCDYVDDKLSLIGMKWQEEVSRTGVRSQSVKGFGARGRDAPGAESSSR